MDKRVEKSNQSILALKRLLEEICNQPDEHLKYPQLILALSSQSALAKFTDKELGIHSSSINTLKRTSENLIPGGFQAFDQLRIRVKLIVDKKNFEKELPSKESKAGLLLANKNLKADLDTLRGDLLLITLAFEKSLTQGARYAGEASPIIQALCKKEQRELMDIITLRNLTFDKKILKLRGHQE